MWCWLCVGSRASTTSLCVWLWLWLWLCVEESARESMRCWLCTSHDALCPQAPTHLRCAPLVSCAVAGSGASALITQQVCCGSW